MPAGLARRSRNLASMSPAPWLRATRGGSRSKASGRVCARRPTWVHGPQPARDGYVVADAASAVNSTVVSDRLDAKIDFARDIDSETIRSRLGGMLAPMWQRSVRLPRRPPSSLCPTGAFLVRHAMHLAIWRQRISPTGFGVETADRASVCP
jgi:hypothetical protein